MKNKFNVLLLLIMIFMLSGCVTDTNPNMISALEKKYGEKCTYVKPWGGEGMPGHGFYASCNNISGEIFVFSKDDGKTISDNYMDLKYKNETGNYLKNIAKNYYDDFTIEINTSATVSVDYVTPEMTFDEYIKAPNNLEATISVNQPDEYITRSFAQKLIELGHYFSLTISNKNPDGKSYFANYDEGDDELYFSIDD